MTEHYLKLIGGIALLVIPAILPHIPADVAKIFMGSGGGGIIAELLAHGLAPKS